MGFTAEMSRSAALPGSSLGSRDGEGGIDRHQFAPPGHCLTCVILADGGRIRRRRVAAQRGDPQRRHPADPRPKESRMPRRPSLYAILATLLAAFTVGLGVGVHPALAAVAPVRIMALGDSITAGP